jgi:hypothetical protein
MSTDHLAEFARDAGSTVTRSEVTLPIDAHEAVIVVGSQAFNEADRTMDRADVRSLQVLTAGASISGGRFDHIGVRGLRDFLPIHDGVHALATTANDLVLHNLVDDAQATWPVEGLADIHALTPVEEGVLVASTATDVVWEIGLDGNPRGSIDLAPLRHRQARPIAHDRALGGVFGGAPVEATDHFHANEAFIGHDGHRYAVVHHVAGFRPMINATNRLVGHGAGGVIDLDDMRAYDLELVGPHSARLTPDGYVILDSGRNRALFTDRNWVRRGELELAGWGRGFAQSADGSRWFIGISATRRRYLRAGQTATPNAVTVVADGRVVATRPVDAVEQIWSVHLVTDSFARNLIGAMNRRR